MYQKYIGVIKQLKAVLPLNESVGLVYVSSVDDAIEAFDKQSVYFSFFKANIRKSSMLTLRLRQP